jgi:hypothetical protein
MALSKTWDFLPSDLRTDPETQVPRIFEGLRKKVPFHLGEFTEQTIVNKNGRLFTATQIWIFKNITFSFTLTFNGMWQRDTPVILTQYISNGNFTGNEGLGTVLGWEMRKLEVSFSKIDAQKKWDTDAWFPETELYLDVPE